jgi:2-polyprenyl-6-methoxyphenol hydroxylase-like FAD-dependent oxidoreductase
LLDGGAEEFWRKLAKLTPLAKQLEIPPRFPVDFKHVRRPFGHAQTYVADGTAILGDAAHPMSPAGGQGANAAIWDALALADVAHEALSSGDVSRQKLARYESLRRQHNAASVRISRIAAGALGIIPRIPGRSRVALALLSIIDSLPALKALFVGTISTTFVTRRSKRP